MDQIISFGLLQVNWKNGNKVTTGEIVSKDGGEERLEVRNELTLEINNACVKEPLVFDYDDEQLPEPPEIEDMNSYEQKPRIYLFFPAGNQSFHFTTIELEERITASVSVGWKIIKRKSKKYGYYWTIIPDESVVMYPGDRILIHFDQIYTFAKEEQISCIGIWTRDLSKDMEEDILPDRLGYLPMGIERSNPYIRKFRADTAACGVLDTVSFEWDILGCNQNHKMYPACDDLGNTAIHAKDSKTCTVYETTDYMIASGNDNRMVYAHYPVTVREPQIISFDTKDGERKYLYGDSVILTFEIANTRHCYLNKGIGRMDLTPDYSKGYEQLAGEVPVTLINGVTEFELSCLGRNGLVQSTVTITITDLLEVQLLTLTRSFNPNQMQFVYTLSWIVNNATYIKLTTSDGVVRYESSKDSMKLQDMIKFNSTCGEPLSVTIVAKRDVGIDRRKQEVMETVECVTR
ncbi:MAG TPA: hypothetical protein DCW90_09545 [Lachnospiraceae bacterium]|nr:hypothetical protein [Lachnospiraceae bacterium]